jgi:hypothetical protein
LTGEYTVGAGDTMPFNGGGFGGLAELGTDNTGVPASYTTGTQLYGGEAGFVNGGLTPIQLTSYNAQIQIFLPPSIGTIFTAGYGEIFASNTGTFAAGAVSVNDDSNLFVNVMQDFNKEVRVGLEYSQYWTHYTAAANNDPTDQRLQLSTWYRF